jgi:hypothetical protein
MRPPPHPNAKKPFSAATIRRNRMMRRTSFVDTLRQRAIIGISVTLIAKGFPERPWQQAVGVGVIHFRRAGSPGL